MRVMNSEIASKKKLKSVYWAGFLLAIHLASTSYINSSLLSRFVSGNALDILYVVGSLLSLISLLLAPLFLRKYGSLLTILFFATFKLLATFGLAIADKANLIIPFFLINISTDSILYLCLDVNLEKETKAENTTGGKRGIFLTVQNFAWVLAPLALVFLATQKSFSKVYLLSGLALFVFLVTVILVFNNVKEENKTESKMLPALKQLARGGDLSRIIWSQFILNFFYSWMIIYLPLLLNVELGFGWNKIGIMFVVMLLPFILLELPAGILSDKKIGEKEILVFGFLVMFLSTLAIPSLGYASLTIWALALFATRVGASLVEISSESYFFKHVKDEDTGIMSVFRIVKPVSYMIAPLIAMPVIYFFSYSTSFYFLAFFVLTGLFFIPKVDTK